MTDLFPKIVTLVAAFTAVWKWLVEAVSNLLKIVFQVLLFAVFLILFALCSVFAFVWKITVSIKNENRKARNIIKGMATWLYAINYAFDLVGTVAFSGFFDWLFLLPNPALSFTEKKTTASKILGWNAKYGTLNKNGKRMVALLDWIDKDHCEKARISSVEDARKILELESTLTQTQ